MLSKQSQSSDKAQHILASATQLNRMIDDLLDVSRLESHRLDLKHAEVDLPALIRSDGGADGGRDEGHRVDVEVLERVPPLPADPGRLEQVLTNLLSNAAKYGAPETPIEIAVERRSGASARGRRERGNGIAPDDVPRPSPATTGRARRKRRRRRRGWASGSTSCGGSSRPAGGGSGRRARPEDDLPVHAAAVCVATKRRTSTLRPRRLETAIRRDRDGLVPLLDKRH